MKDNKIIINYLFCFPNSQVRKQSSDLYLRLLSNPQPHVPSLLVYSKLTSSCNILKSLRDYITSPKPDN